MSLTLKLESIERNGAPRPLTAEPDTQSAPKPTASPRSSNLRSRFSSVMADNQDRYAAIIQVLDLRYSLALPEGYESKWFTASPGQ